MSFEHGLQGVQAGLKQLAESLELSDFIIACGGTEHKVHRIVLFMQSDVLYRISTSPGFRTFKEAQTGWIELQDDNPVLVSALVHFLYHLTYEKAVSELVDMNDRSAFHVKMAFLADKYNMKHLAAHAFHRFAEVGMRSKAFARGVDEAYSSEAGVTRFREQIVKRLTENPDLVSKKNNHTPLRAVFLKHRQLAVDLSEALLEYKVEEDQRGCWFKHGNCEAFKAKIMADEEEIHACPFCYEYIDGESWFDYQM